MTGWPIPDVPIIHGKWHHIHHVTLPEKQSMFADLVAQELAAARKGHARQHSAHEGYAVLLEEMDELKAEVWLKQSLRSNERMLNELVQVAAMAQRMAEDLELV